MLFSCVGLSVVYLLSGAGVLPPRKSRRAFMMTSHMAPVSARMASRTRHGDGHEHVHIKPCFLQRQERSGEDEQATRECGKGIAARVQQRWPEFKPLQKHPGSQHCAGGDDERIARQRCVVMAVLAGAAGFGFRFVVVFGAHGSKKMGGC